MHRLSPILCVLVTIGLAAWGGGGGPESSDTAKSSEPPPVNFTVAIVETAPFGDLYFQGDEGPQGCGLMSQTGAPTVTIRDASGTTVAVANLPATAKSDWSAGNCTTQITVEVPGGSDFYEVTLSGGGREGKITAPAATPMVTFTT